MAKFDLDNAVTYFDDMTVNGIPCIIAVTDYDYQKPNPSSWDSDLDYYGYQDYEFIVLDRKGYPAEWLQKKMTKKDSDRIDILICDYFEGLRQDDGY